MKRLVTIGLIVVLHQGLVQAAGPVEESGQRAAMHLARAAGSQPGATTGTGGKVALWTGVALAATGTTLIIVGRESCENLGGTIEHCTESSSLKWLGVGTAAGGAALLIVGLSSNAQIGIQRNSLAYRLSF